VGLRQASVPGESSFALLWLSRERKKRNPSVMRRALAHRFLGKGEGAIAGGVPH